MYVCVPTILAGVLMRSFTEIIAVNFIHVYSHSLVESDPLPDHYVGEGGGGGGRVWSNSDNTNLILQAPVWGC